MVAPNSPAASASKPANPLVALLANRTNLGSIGATIARFGARGLLLAARAYLGPLAYRAEASVAAPAGQAPAEQAVQVQSSTTVGGLTPAEVAVLALALAKLAYEIGELALYNPEVEATGKMPAFELDEQGHAPALSLAHVIAAARWWDAYSTRQNAAYERARVIRAPSAQGSSAALLMAARTARYAATPRYSYTDTSSPRSATGVAMTKSTSRGCSSCGGAARASANAYTGVTGAASPYVRSTAGSRLAGNAAAAARMPSTSNCGCGCGGGKMTTNNGCACGCTPQSCGCGCGSQLQTCSCGSGLPATATYDSSLCPTFAISCETKTALRDCMKTALCDFMRCIADTLCPDGRFDSNVFNDPQLGKELVDCVGQLACSFVHCVPDALCGPACSAAPPADCVPCDYAVEVLR